MTLEGPRAGIASISLHPWNINVFYIGNDGVIWNSFRAGSSWTTWEVIRPSSAVQPSAGVAPPGGGIAAVARSAGNMHVYYIGNDGGLWSSSWSSGGNLANAIARANDGGMFFLEATVIRGGAAEIKSTALPEISHATAIQSGATAT